MDFLDMRFDMVWDYRELFIRGIGVTLALTLVGYLGGFILGFFLGIGKLSKRKWIYYPSKL